MEDAARIAWVPSLSADVVSDATPEPLSATGAPSAVVPSLNCTDPTETGLPAAVTVAVKVTGAPVVEVATAATSVEMIRLQPPAIVPTAPVASSTAYRCQVPFGLMPENAPANVVWVDGLGAGVGKLSPPPLFVGR